MTLAATRTNRQTTAHEIAELARSIGLPEDDPIITRAQEIWWEEENRQLTPIGTYKITGYDPHCRHCCGSTKGITASGIEAIIGETVAMKGYPFGTRIYIEGLGYFTVHDRGGFAPSVIDVAVSSHAEAFEITGWRQVYLVEG